MAILSRLLLASLILSGGPSANCACCPIVRVGATPSPPVAVADAPEDACCPHCVAKQTSNSTSSDSTKPVRCGCRVEQSSPFTDLNRRPTFDGSQLVIDTLPTVAMLPLAPALVTNPRRFAGPTHPPGYAQTHLCRWLN